MKKFIVAVILIAVGYALNDVVRFFREFDTSYMKLCTIETGVYNAYIDVLSPTFNEMSQSLMYKVRTGDTVVSPTYRMTGVEIGRGIHQADFITLTAKNGDLVAVVFKNEPDNVLAIYDFSTGETWPRSAYTEDYASTRARGEMLLEFLRDSTGNTNLSLGER